MALTYDSTNDIWTDSFTINKASGTKLLLSTNDKYVTGDIEFTIGVSSGSATTPATTITSEPSISIANDILTASNSKTQNITPTVSAGWVTSGTAGTITVDGSKSITALTIPVSNSFSIIQTAASSANTNKKLTITNNANRNISITNNANATTTIATNAGTTTVSSNSGTVNVTSASASAGTIIITAYKNSSTTQNYTVVSGGKWILSTPSIVNAGTGTSTGTIAFGKQIKIPKGVRFTDIYYTAQLPTGNIQLTASSSTDVSQYATATVKTATVTVKGGALTDQAASITPTNATLSDTNNSGIVLVAKGTAGRAVIKYNGAVSGFVSASNNANVTGGDAITKTTWNGTTYYIDAVTLPTTKSFSVTTSAGASGDTGYLTIVNNSNRTVTATNATNGIIEVTSNNGIVQATSASASAGTVKLNAYNDATTAALTGLVQLVTGGKWVYGTATLSGSKQATAPTIAKTTTTASGATNVGDVDKGTTAPTSGYFVSVQATAPATTSITPTVTLGQAGYLDKAGRITGSVSTTAKTGSVYYVTVKSASPTFQGGALSGTATVGTWNNLTTGSSNTSGVSIVTGGTHTRTAVTYKDAVNGYLVKSAGAATNLTASGNVNLTTSTYYITGVTINVSKNFNITIPNGTTTPNLTLNFAVDASGNVVVT